MRFSIVTAAVLLAAATLTAQSWGPDIRLTYDPADSRNSGYWIATNGDTVHIVWHDNRDGNWEIYYKRSIDCGFTWEYNRRLTVDPHRSYSPQIAVSGDNIHVVWKDNRDGRNEAYYKQSKDGGQTWEPDRRLTNDAFMPEGGPLIAVSGNYVHIVWEDLRHGNPNWEIYYKRSTDNGTTWGPDTRLTTHSGPSRGPYVAASGNGVHVVWWDIQGTSTYETFYVHSLDNGTTWGSNTLLTANDGARSDCCSVTAFEDDVYVVWHDVRFGGSGQQEVFYTHSGDDGATWGAETRLTDAPSRSEYPQMKANGDNLHLLWRDTRDGNYELYYKNSADGGITWSNDTRLTKDPATSSGLSLALTKNHVHVVWYDYRDGNSEIYYKRKISVLPKDVGPVAIVSPPDRIWAGSMHTPQAVVANYGGVQVSFDVACGFAQGGNLVYTDTVTVADLAAGDTTLVSFADWTSAREELVYTMAVATLLEDDSDPSNDVITKTVTTELIDAVVDFDPDRLNFKSEGKWVTCFIELTEGYSAEEIDESTVAITKIDGEHLSSPLYREGPSSIGDYDEDGIVDLMVKFDRQKLISVLQSLGYGDGDVAVLTVDGDLVGGEPFRGANAITIIDKGKKKGNTQSDDLAAVPSEVVLLPNSPNPFRSSTQIRFGLPKETHVSLEVYSVNGQRIATLLEKSLDPGYHHFTWNGLDDDKREVPSGVYLVVLRTETKTVPRKILFLR